MNGWMDGWMDGWMTVFQSYQDDGRFIMKCCEQWSSVYG